MTDREAAIERVRGYVEAWKGYPNGVCLRQPENDPSSITLGDLRALLDEVERLREERAQAADAANDWHGKATYEEDRATRAEAHAAALAGALEKLAFAEREYRAVHNMRGQGHPNTLRYLDLLKDAGDQARQALSAYRGVKDELRR